MSESWTNHQIQAINTTGCNLLVAAAAGSGKTAVLVQRIVKMVTREDEKSVDIDRLLVMTFTNAAASEMRERLGIELAKALSENPNSTRLQSQMVLLNKASISTIHSFCLQVIKNNFHKLDLDPVFRIGDETEILLLKQEAVEGMLEDYYSSEEVDERFISLVENYSGNKNDNVIQELIFDLYNFSMSLPWPKKWLLDSAEVFNVKEDFDFGKSIWGKTIFENTTIEVKGLKSMMEKALKIIDNEPTIEGYRVSFQEEINMLSGLCDGNDLDDMIEKLKVVTFARLKAVKNPNQFAKDRVQEIRNKVKKRITEISKELTASTNESIIETMVKLYPTMKCLVELVINFDKVFKVKKKERGIIDFNDIEHFCLDLLCTIDGNGEITPSETALEYRKKFNEVLVDEYQDCNMVQEVIMSMVSRKDEDTPNLFMVGDVKQSIYRFRHARPELFLEKYNSYLETEDASSRKIMLFKNFRSKKGIIEGVNYVFNKIMSKTLGELNYDENEALNFGAEYYYENEDSELKIFDETIELNVVEKDSKVSEDSEVDDEPQETLDKIQLEAKLVAKKILGILDYYIYDKNLKKYRKIEFRDIVILLRTTTGWCEVFMEELKNSNIPAYSDTGTGYFDTIEIKTMMSLLQIIDNPLQDIPMLSVLRSPIFGFTPEELIDLKIAKKKIYVYEEIKEACKGNGDISKDLVEKCGDFLKKLSYWRKKSHTTPIDEFVWYLYTDTGYYGYTGAMPGGVQRQANLRLLFQRAKQFGETSFKGVFNFILFIERLRTSSGDMGSAKILSENENVVRIMSIHKSKGLEFPVVILSGLGKKFNLMDMNKKILFHQELGLAPDFVDYKRRISYPTEIKNALKSKLTNETLSEEMRILYVAMTRAKEKLILTGVTKNYMQELMKWGEGIDEGGGVSKYYILKNTCFLRWIGAAIIAHDDCEDIRIQSGTDFCDGYKHGSKWKVIHFSESDFKYDSAETQENNFSLEQYCNNEKGSYFEEIQRRLTHTYPYAELTKLPGKISVSEIKKRFQTFDEDSEKIFVPELKKIPNFLTDKKLTPSEKGTAMHTVMQHINLKGNLNYDGIKLQIHELVIKDILTEMQAESIKVRNIARLFTSELGMRMVKSQSINREATFQIKVPAGEIYPELQESRYNKCEIIVQGAIDCYFYEGDEIVIVDYKTDYVDDTNKNDIIEKYRIQLDYYQRAIGKITGSKVKEKYIYLFYTGEFVRIECK